MRILFVSGVSVGGSARSTCELATALAARGHEISVLLPDRMPPLYAYAFRRARNLEIKHGREDGSSSTYRRLLSVVGARAVIEQRGPFLLFRAWRPENAARRLILRTVLKPELVVASSLDRRSWLWLRTFLISRRIPSVLYMREEVALGHLKISGAPPDLLLSNSPAYCLAAQSAGYEAVYIPSVVDVSATSCVSTREAALVINLSRDHGVDTAIALAGSLPWVPFIFQCSWPMSSSEMSALRHSVANLHNVELRPRTGNRSELFAQARVLVAPHVIDNRPRSVLEAQSNGIPVIATDLPGLRDVVGEGGILIPRSASIAEWASVLARMWMDDVLYTDLSNRALQHASRVDAKPAGIAELFERHADDVVARVRG